MLWNIQRERERIQRDQAAQKLVRKQEEELKRRTRELEEQVRKRG